MERKSLYGELFVFKFKLLKPQLRVHVYKKMALFLITWYSCSFLVLVACREIGSLPEQVKQKANLWDYNIQSRISPCLKKHFKIWVPSLQAINMCGLFTTFLLLTWKKSAITASMMCSIQLRDGSANWPKNVERSLIVAMYQVFLCLPAQHRKVF